MATFNEVTTVEEKDQVLKHSKLVTSGMQVPDGTYEAYVSKVGAAKTQKGNMLMTFQGKLTGDGGFVKEFTGTEFIVITDSIVWREMEPGKRYKIVTENRRISQIIESDGEEDKEG